MPVDIGVLADDLARETASLVTLLDALTEADWARASPAPGWSVSDQVTHLAYFDDMAVLAAVDRAEFERRRDEGPPDADRITERVAKQFRGMEPTALHEWFLRARAELDAVYRALDPSARLPWYGPDMSAAAALTARIMETWAHGTDIADAVGRPWPVTAALRQVAHLCVRALPNSFRAQGRPDPGVEVRVELTPLRRGVLRFTGLTLARPDPLGLLRALVTVPLPQTALILPRRYPLPPFAAMEPAADRLRVLFVSPRNGVTLTTPRWWPTDRSPPSGSPSPRRSPAHRAPGAPRRAAPDRERAGVAPDPDRERLGVLRRSAGRAGRDAGGSRPGRRALRRLPGRAHDADPGQGPAQGPRCRVRHHVPPPDGAGARPLPRLGRPGGDQRRRVQSACARRPDRAARGVARPRAPRRRRRRGRPPRPAARAHRSRSRPRPSRHRRPARRFGPGARHRQRLPRGLGDRPGAGGTAGPATTGTRSPARWSRGT